MVAASAAAEQNSKDTAYAISALSRVIRRLTRIGIVTVIPVVSPVPVITAVTVIDRRPNDTSIVVLPLMSVAANVRIPTAMLGACRDSSKCRKHYGEKQRKHCTF